MKKSPIKKRNVARQKRKKLDDNVFGSLYGWAVANEPCGFLLRGNHMCWGDKCGHHVKTRGSGAKDRLDNGDGNVYPVCQGAHQEIHCSTKEEIWMRYEVDLKKEAKAIGKRFDKRNKK